MLSRFIDRLVLLKYRKKNVDRVEKILKNHKRFKHRPIETTADCVNVTLEKVPDRIRIWYNADCKVIGFSFG